MSDWLLVLAAGAPFALTTLLAVAARRRLMPALVGWLAFEVATALFVMPGRDASRFVAPIVLSLPGLAACLAVATYAVGRREVGNRDDGRRDTSALRWRRVGIALIATVLIAAGVELAVELGLKSARSAQQAAVDERVAYGLRAAASDLRAVQATEDAFPLAEVTPILADVAAQSGRSVYLFAANGGGARQMVAGARWASTGLDTSVTAVTTSSQLPAREAAALRAYLRRPLAYIGPDVAWRARIGAVPLVTPIRVPALRQDAMGGATETRTVKARSSADDVLPNATALLVSVPAAQDEWWSEATRTEYRGSLAWAMFSLVSVLLGTAMLVLYLLDSRAALQADMAVTRERETLRRDAHDRVFNRLAAVAHSLDSGTEVPRTRELSEDLRDTLGALQAILADPSTRDATVQEAALADRIAEVCTRAEHTWGMRVTTDCRSGISVAGRLGWALDCLVEEALANAGEHGAATRARVSGRLVIEGGAEALEIVVADNGTWRTAENPSSSGVTGMAARAREFGGSVTVEHSDDGTTVTARIPCP